LDLGQAFWLIRWGLHIPEDVHAVGIEDVNYSSMLQVPLTTIKQPIEQIGESVLRLILERIQVPSRPVLKILLDGYLVVREASGGILPNRRPLIGNEKSANAQRSA
jgi:DNA-binding LacI/PurR family transcriptional regulator